MKNKIKTPKIHPRGSWVLVRPIEPQSQNEYGLSIPDSVEKEQKSQGEIIEVGPKTEGLKKGQIVLYGAFAGEPIQFGSRTMEKDKVDLILLLEDDILAFIEV